MKKVVVMLCAASSCVWVAAQSPEAGRFRIGATASGGVLSGRLDGIADSGRVKAIGFGFRGTTGYFIVDGMEFGPLVSFSYTRFKNGNGEIATQVESTVGVQAAYFFRTNHALVPFVQLTGYHAAVNVRDDTGFVFGTTDEPDHVDRERHGFGIEPAVGVEWFLTRALAIEGTCSFSYREFDHVFGFAAGLCVFL